MKAELGKHANSPSDSQTGSAVAEKHILLQTRVLAGILRPQEEPPKTNVCVREGKRSLEQFQQSWTEADCFSGVNYHKCPR